MLVDLGGPVSSGSFTTCATSMVRLQLGTAAVIGGDDDRRQRSLCRRRCSADLCFSFAQVMLKKSRKARQMKPGVLQLSDGGKKQRVT